MPRGSYSRHIEVTGESIALAEGHDRRVRARHQRRHEPAARGAGRLGGRAPLRGNLAPSSETGTAQVYVRSFAGALCGAGGKWQISTNGGLEPVWRGDGKELHYVDGNKVMAVEVNGDGESFRAGTPTKLFEANLPLLSLRNCYVVSSDGKRFLVNTLMEQQHPANFTLLLNWPALLKR